MAFDPWTVGLTVLGGLFGSRSSSKAADANVQAQREQLALQERMFQQTRQDYKPWMDAGVPALNEMMRMVGLQPSAGVPSLGDTIGGGGAGGSAGGASGFGGLYGDSPQGAVRGGSTGLPPGMGGLNPPGSEMPGVGTGYIHAGMNRPQPFSEYGHQYTSPNTTNRLQGSPMTPASGFNVMQGVAGDPYGPNADLHRAFQQSVSTDAPTERATLESNLATIMGNRERNEEGNRVSDMGGSRTRAGMRVGTVGPDSMALNDASVSDMTPMMQHAAADYINRASITPRFRGGPMEQGNMYSVAELEPEMVTTPQGSQLVTQPSIMQATQPGYVTPGPIGQSMQSPSLAQSIQPDPMGAVINDVGGPQVGGYNPKSIPSIGGATAGVAPTGPIPPYTQPGSGEPFPGGLSPGNMLSQPGLPPQGLQTGPYVDNMPQIINTPPPAGSTNFGGVQTGGSGGAMQGGNGILQNAPGSFPAIGVTTTPQLQQNPYSFMSDDPSYGFRFQEGQRAVESSAAARGGLLSGGTAKRLNRYGQDYASNEFMNRFNRLSTISGMGQTMTQGMGQLGQGYGGQMGNIIGGMGQSRASGYLGQGSAMGQSLQNLAFLNAYRPGGG